MPLRGLTIVIGGGATPPDLRTALALALAQIALGGAARLFLDGAAVRLAAADDGAALLGEALGDGVAVTLCQTGLAEAGLAAARLDPRFDYGGPVGLLAALGDDRLVAF